MADRISVIVPVYNVAADLPRCLDSLLAQTYSDIQIVAVNDGSLDDSGAILDRYAEDHPHIRVIHKENGGVTSARFRGVQEATGEWIGFVDGDDEIEPDMYERLLCNAKEHDAQISHCGYQMRFADGRIHYFHNTGLLAKQDKITALRELLSGAMIEPGLCNKLFHKTLFPDLLHGERIDTKIKINEDLLVNFYLFSAARFSVFEDWCPYHYIVRDGSASRAKLNANKIYDPIRVKQLIRDHASEDLYYDVLKAYINTCMNTYHTVLLAGPAYQDDLYVVTQLLAGERKHFSLLGKKRKFLAYAMIKIPFLYKLVYRFYSRFLQKKIYT